MQQIRVNDHDMTYIAVGAGPPLVCVHGSLGDFRVWSGVIGPLSQHRRVYVPSLRHFFPEQWDGRGGRFTMAQHVADTVGFIRALELGPVDLMGHSRGGHIAFRVAQQEPGLVRRLVLAEPGGELDGSLAPPGAPPAGPGMRERTATIAKMVASGDVDGAMALFTEAIEGPGGWQRLSPVARQVIRDNALTMLGQVNEQRQPFTLADARAIRAPTLFVAGSDTVGSIPMVGRALAAHVAGARTVTIPGATHWMFDNDPPRFCAEVLGFLDQP